MQKPLEVGSGIIIDAEKYVIQDVIGTGASSIVYYARQENGRKVVIKEFYPLVPNCKRCEDGIVVVEEHDKKSFEEAKDRFVDGFKTQFRFRNSNDMLANSIFDAERIGEYNSTQYIVTSYMVGKSLDKMRPRSMYQLLTLVRAVSVLVQEYHNQGYLHLDIKPENIFRRSDTDDTVILFDFDSITKIDDIKEGRVGLLSYSPIWAAPELRQGRINIVSEATDIFSLGAIVFDMFFGREITALDSRSNSEWEFDTNHPLLENVVSKTKLIEGLREFFHKTIVANPKRRYQDIAQFIKAIDELLIHANTKEVKLLSTFKHRSNFFIGRENELKQLDKLIAQEKMIFIHGVGGIGKTELAKQYANSRFDKYDAVVFGICEPDIKAYVISDKIITLLNWDEGTERTKEEEYYEKKRLMLKKICNNQKILLIVDNLDDLKDKKLNDLEKLGCDVIVTTRNNCSAWQLPYISIGQIEDATELFYHYYKRPVVEEEKIVIKEIVLEKLFGHTMFVVLIANIMMLNRISPQEMLDKMENSGIGKWGDGYARIKKDDALQYDKVIDVGKRLFNIVKMTDEELYIMGNMALIPRSGIDAKFFKELLKLESYEIINKLAHKGMLQIDDCDDYIKLHPVIAEIFMDVVEQHKEWGTELLKRLFNFLENEHGTCKENELYEILFIVQELIHTYILKKLDYDTFREVITNRILYGKMLRLEYYLYAGYPTLCNIRSFMDKVEKESLEYYKFNIAYSDINIFGYVLGYDREEKYFEVLERLLFFEIKEAYVLRMHIITMLLANDFLGRGCASIELEKCRSLFLESRHMYQKIRENGEDREIISYCKKQLLMQAACIQNKIIVKKEEPYFKRIHPASYEKQYLKKLMQELETEIETERHYKELKELYRLLYSDKNIDWKLQFADTLIEVGELAKEHSSMYTNSFLAEALDVYVNRFGENNRTVIELYLKFAETFGEKEYIDKNHNFKCIDRNLGRVKCYYNKALKSTETLYGINSSNSAFIHSELGKCNWLEGNNKDAKREYRIALDLLKYENMDPETIWRTFRNEFEIHIEYKEYENALTCIEQAFERCAQLDFAGARGTYLPYDFFSVGEYCDDAWRFEKCIETYMNVYIKKKSFEPISFYREAGDYYYSQSKYYEAEQYYHLWMEMDEFEFCDEKKEYEYLLRKCKICAETGKILKAKESIVNLITVCKAYEVKEYSDLKFVLFLMLQMFDICEMDMQEDDLLDVIVKTSITILDSCDIEAFDLNLVLFVTYAMRFTEKKDFEKTDVYWGYALYYDYCRNVYDEVSWEDEEVDILEFVHFICENALPQLFQYYKYMDYIKKSKWSPKKACFADVYNDFMVLVCYFIHKEEEAAIRMSSNIIAKWGHMPDIMKDIERGYIYIAKCKLQEDAEFAIFFNTRVREFFEARAQEIATYIEEQDGMKEG